MTPAPDPADDPADDPAVDVDVGDEDALDAAEFVVSFDDRNTRLDAYLGHHLAGTSRSRAAALVDEGCVAVDGVVVKKSAHKLRANERVVVTLPAPTPTTLVAEDLPLTLVYDDTDFCVVDKAAGVVVHPGAGHASGTIANALLFRFPQLSIGGERRPGIVHRLDKDTSGLLVVAKNDEAQRALAKMFHDRAVDKRYVAVCLGVPLASSPGPSSSRTFELVTGHRRHNADRRRYTTKLPPPEKDDTNKAIRRAHSRFTVRAERDGAAVLDVELFTGRTHQIRAHLADLGHPLLQDELYGGAHAEKRIKPGPVRDVVVQLRRHALHAATLSFAHPKTGAPLVLTSPLPADLGAVVDAIEVDGA